MKTKYLKLRSLLTVAMVACALPQAWSQIPAQPPTISVTGSAEVKVVPDQIFLRVGVETRSEALDDARKENDDRIAKAMAFLKAREIPAKDIQMDYVNVDPNYESSSGWRAKPVGYTVRKSIEIKLTNVAAFEPLLTGLLTNGVNNVHGIEFRTSQLRKHRDTARALAVRAAREKADALATELGVKRGKVQSINEYESGGWFGSSTGYWGARYGFNALQNQVQNVTPQTGDDESNFSVGQISVTATVNVNFLIE